MSLISQRLGLLNGVSQKPQEQRLSSQAQDQVNGLSNLVRGLMKRPPLVWVGLLTAVLTGWSTAFIHSIVRDSSERYHVVVVNGQVQVYNSITLAAQTVIAREGTAYLSGDNGAGFRAATAGDTTIIVNRGKTVLRGTTKSAALIYQALVFVRQADYSTLYSVTINNKTVAIRTVDQSTSATREALGTDTIAANLMATLKTAFPTDFTFTQYGSTIHIRPTAAYGTTKDFALSVSDGLADQGLRAVKGSVQLFEDLPAKAPHGFIIEVAGDPESDKDNYWLRYDSEGNTQSGLKGSPSAFLSSNAQHGIWRECPRPGTLLALDKTTLPHRLTRKGSIVHNVAHDGIAVSLAAVQETVRASAITTYDWSNFLDNSAIAAGATATVQDNATGMKKTPGAAGSSFHVSYFIDASQIPAGEVATVSILVNAAVVKSNTYTNNTGSDPLQWDPRDVMFLKAIDGTDQQNPATEDPMLPTRAQRVVLAINQAITNTDVVSVKLTYASGFTPSSYRRASLTVEPASLVVTNAPYQRIDLIGELYPAGTQIQATLDGSNVFTYTVGATDETAATVATGLGALIDASPTYIVTANTSGVVIDVKRADGAAFTAAVTVTLNEAVIFHNSTLTLTTNELAGKTIRNLSDGSSGTVSSNMATTIVVASLSGGADNKFQRGDIVSVVGSGTYFVFEPCPWKDRGAGDDVTVPFPSFVDNTIKDVVFYQNRLGFCSNENVVFSASGDLFNFFRFTATQLLSDDVIDVRASHKEVSLFDSFVPWGTALYAKSDNAQWLISGEPVLTPATVRIDLVSKVLNSPGLPVVLGNRMYLFRGKDGYTQVQEYEQLDTSTPQLDWLDITQDNPRYLKGSPIAMVGDDSLGVLIVLTDDSGQKNLYIYSYAFQGDKRVQSSWSQWQFANGAILGLDVVDGQLGVVVLHSDVAAFYTLNLNVQLDTLDSDEAVRYLDRRMTNATSGVSSAFAAGTTTWTLPVSIATDGSEGTVSVVNRTTKVVYTVTRPAANQVAVTGQGDLTGTSVYIGVSYPFTYTLSRIYVRGQDQMPETDGWIILRNLKISYRDTTNFSVVVTISGRASPWTYTVSKTTPATDILRVPVQARNLIATLQLTNSTPGGCAFSGIDWEGDFSMRSRRF